MKAYYRPLEQSDLLEVLQMDIREADKEELEAIDGLPWKDMLAGSILTSDLVWVIIYNGNIEGIFGLREISAHIAVPWFVATDRLGNFSYRFLRESREVVALMQQLYPTLFNFVSTKHVDAIRWLTWLGFTLKTDEAVTAYNGTFIPFEMRRKQ